MFSDNFQELIDYTTRSIQNEAFDSYEIAFIDRLNALTRYANSTIHQNVSDHTYRFIFKVAKGKKVCTSTLTSLTKRSIDVTLSQLNKMLEFVPEIPFFQGFSINPETKIKSINTTGNLLDEVQRADMVEVAVKAAEEVDKKVNLAGSVSINDLRFMIVNSNGLELSHRITYNEFVVNSLTERKSKGYAKENQTVRNPENLTPGELARKATEHSISTCYAKNFEPGEYEIILSPSAVATLMRFLSFGFNANAYHESQSFITDQIGVQLFDEKLTLKDDPLNSKTILASPFDGEGSIKNPVYLLDEGVPKTIIYNNFLASRFLNDKSKTTGHQIIPYSDYVFGRVLPMNLILSNGDSSFEEMVEETEEGFFVNRLHYTNFVNRRIGAITGLTRDGLFYIKDGEIVTAAKNFRFTDKLTDCLRNVQLIGNTSKTSTTMITPYMKLDSFRFSGKSTH